VLTTCVPCPKGQASPGGSAPCARCGGNTYSYKEGSEECIECGAGTTANNVHNECDLNGCQFSISDALYDLHSLDKELSVKDAMYGPIRDVNADNGHMYFINLCSRQQADDFSCATNQHTKIQSFVCQTTTNLVDSGSHYEGKNLGDTMGVEAAKEGEGLSVIMSHGTKCSNGDVRKTTIDMICDEAAGAGYPESYEGSAEHGHCQYRFEWRTLNACPVCTEAHYSAIVGECTQDSNGAYTQVTQMVKQASCNHLSLKSYQPAPDATASCSQKVAGGSGGGSSSPWYKSPGFLITVIVLSSTLFAVVITFALVKYYKVRRLYEAYAQLDRDRGGMGDDFNTIGTLELEDQMGHKEDPVGL